MQTFLCKLSNPLIKKNKNIGASSFIRDGIWHGPEMVAIEL